MSDSSFPIVHYRNSAAFFKVSSTLEIHCGNSSNKMAFNRTLKSFTKNVEIFNHQFFSNREGKRTAVSIKQALKVRKPLTDLIYLIAPVTKSFIQISQLHILVLELWKEERGENQWTIFIQDQCHLPS